jgi:hypothetical protein
MCLLSCRVGVDEITGEYSCSLWRLSGKWYIHPPLLRCLPSPHISVWVHHKDTFVHFFNVINDSPWAESLFPVFRVYHVICMKFWSSKVLGAYATSTLLQHVFVMLLSLPRSTFRELEVLNLLGSLFIHLR